MREIAMNRRMKPAGFTLVEMIVTIVILAIALVGISSMVSFGTSNSANTLVQTPAIALANAYIDEIMGRRFDERSAASGLNPCSGFTGGDRCTLDASAAPDYCASTLGRDGGEPLGERDRYDDVDDYNGLSEGDGTGLAIADAEGNPRTDYENFHVAVSVRYAGDDEGLGLHCTDAKLITVTVTTRDQQDGWRFSVYRGNY
jgi:MSHA pilin protein MshD